MPIPIGARRSSQCIAAPMHYMNKVRALGPIAYYPMTEPAGAISIDQSSNGRNGAYTGVTLGATGIGDGRTAATFDGATSYNNIYSAALNTAWNGAEWSVTLWFKVSGSGVWTDATARRLVRISVDGSNYVLILRTATNNQLLCEYSAGAVVKSRNISSVTSTDWIFLAFTASKSADATKGYMALLGAPATAQGAVQTGLGTWAGALASTNTVIGASTTTPSLVWSGQIAHVALFGRALTEANILGLATLQ
jgi:hypothetical protein